MSGMQDSTSSSQAVSAVQPAQPEAVESLAAPVITYEQLASDLPKVELDRAVADARPPMTNPGGVDSQQATACDSSDKDGSSRATGSADVGNEAREETPRTVSCLKQCTDPGMCVQALQADSRLPTCPIWTPH
eukprot:6200451-Pleurochrysis_carterae.AAC.2